MRKLDMDRDAMKYLAGLDAKQYKQVAAKMLALMNDTTPPDSSKLKGYVYHRVDSGEYRILYRFEEETVYVILIGKRNGDEVYEKLKRRG